MIFIHSRLQDIKVSEVLYEEGSEIPLNGVDERGNEETRMSTNVCVCLYQVGELAWGTGVRNRNVIKTFSKTSERMLANTWELWKTVANDDIWGKFPSFQTER